MLAVVVSTVERAAVQSQPEHTLPAAVVPPVVQLELQLELLLASHVPTAVEQLVDSAAEKPELWALASLERVRNNSTFASRSGSVGRRAMTDDSCRCRRRATKGVCCVRKPSCEPAFACACGPVGEALPVCEYFALLWDSGLPLYARAASRALLFSYQVLVRTPWGTRTHVYYLPCTLCTMYIVPCTVAATMYVCMYIAPCM